MQEICDEELAVWCYGGLEGWESKSLRKEKIVWSSSTSLISVKLWFKVFERLPNSPKSKYNKGNSQNIPKYTKSINSNEINISFQFQKFENWVITGHWPLLNNIP